MNGSRIIRWTLVAYFFVAENSYFGWNRTRQSGAEICADGIVLLLIAVATINFQTTIINKTGLLMNFEKTP